MWIAIVILSLTVLVLIYFNVSKGKKQDIFARIPHNDLESNAKQLAISMRMPEPVGISPRIKPMLRKIRRAYLKIRDKAEKKDELYEFERWIYQNYYTIVKLINIRDYRTFALLPHKGKMTRILAVAELIVSGSYADIDKKSIDSVINTFNAHTPLHVKEIESLKAAIALALIEKISSIADKVSHYQKMRKLAKKKGIFSKYSGSDAYLYCLRREGRTIDDKEIVKASDINTDNIEYSFTTSLVDNCVVVSNCIKSLKALKNIFKQSTTLEYSYANKLMDSDSVYSSMDNESKIMYLSAVNSLASKFRVSEKMIVDSAKALSIEHLEQFGRYLFENKVLIKAYLFSKKTKKLKLNNTKKLQCVYIAVIYTAAIALATLLGILSGHLWLGIIIFLLAFIAGIPLVEHIVQKAHKSIVTRRPIPKMNIDEVPQEHTTMVVVPCYLADKEQISELSDGLMALRASNGGKNIFFTLLLDYKASSQSLTSEDYEWNTLFQDSLQQYGDINVLVRRRVLINGKYSGYERKRGAISSFNQMLVTGDYHDFSYSMRKDIPKPSYVCVLDADSKLMPQSLKKAIAEMAHPLNIKYDLLSFGNKYDMNSLVSVYSKKFYFDSGYEGYNDYSSYYFDAFDRAIFCGKGIYRLGNFFSKLDQVLPSGKVLSHDIIEGALLNCGSSSVTVYEQAPTSFASDIVRSNRWLAGDTQLSTMIKSKIRGSDGKVRKVNKQPIYNHIMLSNLLKAFAPMAMLLLLLVAFLGNNIFFAIPIITLFGGSLLIRLIEKIAGVNKNIKYKYIFYGIWQVITQTFFQIVLLPFYAVNNLYVIIKQSLKLVFARSGELRWKTFSQTQNEQSFLSHVMLLTPSFLIMIAVAMLGYNNLWVLGYFAMFYAFAIAIYPLSVKQADTQPLSDNQKQLLMMYANKTYDYFDLNRNSNHLIADNYQLKPYKGVSEGTSPTNIGFSLIAEVSAHSLGIIDNSKAENNLVSILKSIVSLKKYRGHLYNWYDIKTKQIMPPNYISSVDSGNLLASLIVTRQFLIKNKLSGAELCDRLIDNMDFEAVYDRSNGLFYIGYNTQTKEFGGHYDLLASEAQILNYVLSARSGNIFTWNNLGRVFTASSGNVLLSWSGTMFEYLMPSIFFKAPSNSLIYITNTNAIKTQKRHRCKGFYGVSESGYYKFDNRLNYQYHAFGDSALALRSESNRCVISPYSSFLSMQYDANSALENLYGLYSEGMFGEYGFYEAIDYTSGKNVVQSYMAHHQGMSIASIANVLCDGIINKLFFCDSSMAGGRLLLCERKSIAKSTSKPKEDYIYRSEYDCIELSLMMTPEYPPQVAMLSNGKYSMYIDALGSSVSSTSGITISKQRHGIGHHQGVSAIFIDKESGEKFSPYCSDSMNFANHTFNASYSSVEMTNIEKTLTQKIYLPHCFDGEIREFAIKNEGLSEKNFEYNIYLDICIDKHEAEVVHPVFSDMFVSSEHLEAKNTVVYHRKSREKVGDRYCAVMYKTKVAPRLSSNRLLVRNRDMIGDEGINAKDFGDILYPCFSMTDDIKLMSGETFELVLVIFYADDIEKLYNMIDVASECHFISYAKKSAEIQAISRVGKLIRTNSVFQKSIYLARDILYKSYSAQKLSKIIVQDLSKTMTDIGLNCNIKTIYFGFDNNKDEFIQLVGIVRYLNLSGIKVNLLVSYKESDIIHQIVHNRLLSILVEHDDYIKLVTIEKITQDVLHCCFMDYTADVSMLESYSNNSRIARHYMSLITPPDYLNKFSNSKIILASGSGGFDAEGGYIVDSPTLLPYSNVICHKYGGTIITNHGGGYSYIGNSRQDKISVWENDPVDDKSSEWVILGIDDRYYQLNTAQDNKSVEHKLGLSVYNTEIEGFSIVQSQYMVEDGRVKVYEINILNNSQYDKKISLSIRINPCLGVSHMPHMISAEVIDNIISVSRADNRKRAYLNCIGQSISLIKNNFSDNVGKNVEYFPNIGDGIVGNISAVIYQGSKKTFCFLLSDDIHLIEKMSLVDAIEGKNVSRQYFEKANTLTIESDNKPLDVLLNKYLIYQVVSSRMNGRCGYYQAGGAIGFRDQLQDCLAMLYHDQKLVKEHIIECASKQFRQGDVLHWWHEGNLGVRTRISDDKLFLPYLVSEYIKFTGDKAILLEQATFLEGDELASGQESMYQHFSISGYSDTILSHCVLAIDNALKYGENDLLLIGSGDWNDALNDIGIDGVGESVWLSMFAYQVISEFLDYIPSGKRGGYLIILDKLYTAVNDQYVGGYYRRARTDKGEWLGDSSSACCHIDLISQAYAVISKIGKAKNLSSSMSAAKTLIDGEKGIIKLLSPPFTKDFYCGYISSYPIGVRENGGQYSHAAIWYIKALALYGQRAKALEMVDMINPIVKCSTESGNRLYMGEPYVMAGDVYTTGQMGWSWYTGSAAWLYKVVIEDIIGIKIQGKEMIFDPVYLPSLGENYEIQLNWHDTVYNISYRLANKKAVSLNGVNYGNCSRNATEKERTILKIPLIEKSFANKIVVEY